VALDRRENAKALFKAVRELPENQKTAFVLHKMEGLSYQDVAQVMDTSVSAVESLLHRAKLNLRKTLENSLGERNDRNF
jgi:RNA polymerase sigma-70 factor (ECF subfamily)